MLHTPLLEISLRSKATIRLNYHMVHEQRERAVCPHIQPKLKSPKTQAFIALVFFPVTSALMKLTFLK